MNPRQFVTELSLDRSGGYTLLPILKGYCLDLPFHIKRLSDSYQQLTQDNSITYKSITHHLLNELSTLKFETTSNGFLTIAIVKPNHVQNSFYNGCSSPTSHHEIKCLFSQNMKSDLIDFASQSSSQLPPAARITIVETFPYIRTNPRCKDIQWPSQRKFIEASKILSQSTEILLKDEQDRYLEGLTSNFFAMDSKSKIVYASSSTSSDVLSGSMARLFLHFCKNIAFGQYGVRIEDRIPLTNDVLSTCDAAFLTSGTKPISAIAELYDFHTDVTTSDSNLNKYFSFSETGLLSNMKRSFIEYLRSDIDWNGLSIHSAGPNQRGSHDLSLLPYPLWWKLVDMNMIDLEQSTLDLVSQILLI